MRHCLHETLLLHDFTCDFYPDLVVTLNIRRKLTSGHHSFMQTALKNITSVIFMYM